MPRNDNKITAERIIQMDLHGNTEEKFAIGCGLGIIVNYFFETKKSGKLIYESNLRAILNYNIKTFAALSKKYPKYGKILQILEE